MDYPPSWSNITDDEVRVAVERDFRPDKVSVVLDHLSRWKLPQSRMAVLMKVRGRFDMLPNSLIWTREHLLATTAEEDMARFRPGPVAS